MQHPTTIERVVDYQIPLKVNLIPLYHNIGSIIIDIKSNTPSPSANILSLCIAYAVKHGYNMKDIFAISMLNKSILKYFLNTLI